MARYFLDSSAFVKRYHQESGSSHVDALFNAPGNRVFVSRLALVEAQSAFARLVREGIISLDDFHRSVSRLEADVAAKVLIVAALTSRRLDEAAAFFATHGLTTNVRTLDAIHLVTARALHARNPLAAFVAADKKSLAAAVICGLNRIDVS
jgi:predicted nucleic acid-binding protein